MASVLALGGIVSRAKSIDPAGPFPVAGHAIGISYSQSLRRARRYKVEVAARFLRTPVELDFRDNLEGRSHNIVRRVLSLRGDIQSGLTFRALYGDTVELVVIEQQNLISFLFNPLSKKGIRSWHEICL